MSEEVFIVGHSTYANQTTAHPLGVLLVVILGLCVIVFPRRWSVLPFIIVACFISSAQRIVVAGMDFDLLRIMVLFGVARLLLRNEHRGFVWNSLDKVLVLWMMSSFLFYILQQGTFAALVNRLGFGFDTLGMYFLFRCLIRDWRDLDGIIRGTILISIPIAAFFLLENRTGRNLFSIFGGVPGITGIREGRLRCQGAFSDAILAGCFWAAIIPLFAGLWWKSAKDRIWAITGITTSLIIILCCASSTPVMGVFAAFIGGLMFYFRRHMRIIRWGILLMLVGLHIVMKAPVWHLISRVSAVGGSTGWHRYNLINETIRHFGDWWICGCSGEVIASWGVFGGDVTNQYILEGVRGGIVTMGLFIALIAVAFREVGRLWRWNRGHRYFLALSWALGVSMFVHCMNYIGVSYFGQITMLWYLLLAIIGSISLASKQFYYKMLIKSPAGYRPAGAKVKMFSGKRVFGKLSN